MRKIFSVLLVILMLVTVFPALGARNKATSTTAPKAKKKAEPADKTKPEPANVLESCSRMLSFDPHPVNFALPTPVVVNGQSFSGEVVVVEKWESKGDKSFLRELGASLRLLQGGTEAQKVEIPALKLAKKKLKAGTLLGDAKGNGVGLQMVVEKVTGGSKSITELVVAFKITGQAPMNSATETTQAAPTVATPAPAAPAAVSASAALSATAPAPANALTVPTSPTGPAGAAASPTPSSGYRMALKLAQRATAMQAGQEAAKLALLKRALNFLPDTDLSTEATGFRGDIGQQINELSVVSTSAGKPDPHEISNTGAPDTTRDTAQGATRNTASGAVGTQPATTHAVPAKAAVDPQAWAWYKEAEKLLDQHMEAEARNLLRKAVEKSPDFYEAWILLGKNAFANSKYARAKESIEKALSLKDDDSRSASLYFKCCYYLGDSEPGLEKLRAMVSRYPKASEPRMALADALFQAGDLPGCQEQCLQQLISAPNDSKAKDLLEKTRERMK